MSRIQEKEIKTTKEYAVTGVHHGSIVIAKSIEQAIRTFKVMYDDEEVTHVRLREEEFFWEKCD